MNLAPKTANGTAGDQHATRSRQPGHQDDPGDPARLSHSGQAAGFGDDRSRQRQRHRDPGCAGFASSRVLGRLAARHRDPGRTQRQRHLRQRRPRRLGGVQRGRRDHDRQYRPRLHRRQPDPPHRSRDPHRRPGGQQRSLPDRRQGTPGRNLPHGAAGHADRDHRGVRGGQDHAVAADRRIHPPQRGNGHVRGPQHPRRVRDDAQQNRDGPAGRRGAPAADGQPGAGLRRRAATAAGHQQRGTRTGRRAGARGTRPDQARRHPRRQALRRATQTRVGRAGTADPAVAATARRADLRSGPCAGPPGDVDAAPARRRGPRGAGGHALGVLPGRVRPDPADRPRWQDRLQRATQPGG